MNPILEVRQLIKRFGGFAAVEEIDLSVVSGEVKCLIGPNGAGKSTFLRLVSGYYAPTQGEIYLNGEAISRLRSHARVKKGMGIKFQIPGIFPGLTVSENLAAALQRTTLGSDLAAAVSVLASTLGLESKLDAPAISLSHGQQQWLDIGMALGGRPSLLLLDEPTAGMSPEETYKTGELLKQLNQKGTTIVVIEHDMAFVRQVADTVSVFHCGRLFREGSIDEIERDEDVVRIYLGDQ